MDQGQSLQLTGKVVNGSVQRNGDTLRFRIADRNGSGPSLPVVYTGEVPDPFRQGREVIVSGSVQDGTFIGKRDSLITKCPSKFQAAPNGQSTRPRPPRWPRSASRASSWGCSRRSTRPDRRSTARARGSGSSWCPSATPSTAWPG